MSSGLLVGCDASYQHSAIGNSDPTMQHVPHPLRTYNLWVDQLQHQMGRIGGSGRSKHVKDMAIVMPDPVLDMFYLRAEKITEPFCSCIYDVSALLPKLPDQDISSFSLVDVVTPHGIAYYDFGRQDRFRLTGHDNIYIEGAYVTQSENDDEMSEFVLVLVCNDPDYGADRPIVDGIRRNADGIWLPIKAHQKAGDAINLVGVKVTQRDSYFIGNDEVCRAAFNEVAKTMCSCPRASQTSSSPIRTGLTQVSEDWRKPGIGRHEITC